MNGYVGQLPELINQFVNIINLKLRVFALKGESVYNHVFFCKYKEKKKREEGKRKEPGALPFLCFLSL